MAEVASAFVSLVPTTKGFGAQASRELSGPLDRAGKDGGKRFGRGMSGGIAALGSKIFAPLAAAAAGVGIASFFKDAVNGASDLNESSTKIEAIFGKASGAVQDFASKGAKALGQTKLQVLDAASSFGTFGKAAGLQGPELAKFSTGLAGLSTDLASFFNTSPEEAAQAISAGLRGEAEPLRQYGVLLDDASLRQEALKQGLIKTTKQALTPQQKVLAAQALIYKQTKDAQGDFARTSGGLANQQRILSAQFSDFKTNLGKALLPVVLKVVTGLNNLGPVLSRIGKFIAPVKEGFVVFFEALKGGEVTTIGPLGRIGDAAYAIRDAFMSALPSVQALLATVVTFVTTRVVPAVRALASYIVANVVPILVTLGGIIVTKIVPAFLAVGRFIYGTVYPALLAIVVAVATRLKPVLDTLFATIKSRIIPVIQLVAAKFQQWWPTIQKVVSFVVTLLGWVLKLAASILGKVLPVVIRFAGFLVTVLVKAIIWVVEAVAKVIGWLIKFGAGVVAVVKKFLEFERGVRGVLQRVVRFFIELPGKIVSAVGHVDDLLLDAGRKIIDGLLRGITEKFDAVKRKLGELTDKLPDWKGPAKRDKTILRKAGQLIVAGFVDGLESKYRDVRKSLTGLTGDVSRTTMQGLREITSGGARIAKAYDTIGGRLQAARKKLADAVKIRDDYAASIRDQFSSFASVVQNAPDAGTLVAKLSSNLSIARRFSANLSKLAKMGLSKTAYRQIVDAGVEQGASVAQALVDGGTSSVRQVNSLIYRLSQTGASFSRQASGYLYQAGVDSAKGLVKGLQSQYSALAEAAKRIAKRLVSEIKKALGIRSPSRVMADEVGRWIPLGVAKGIDGESGSVRSSMARLATTVARPDIGATVGMGGPGGVGSGRLHPADIQALADAMAQRPTILDGRVVSQSVSDRIGMVLR